jgi:class 3 adenylate cyclase
LLIALTATVIISLFLYLKLMLFITVLVLAIGANLPDQLANQLGISQLAMIVASGVLVLMGLLYKFSYPSSPQEDTNNTAETADADSTRLDTLNSRKDIVSAIVKGSVPLLHPLLIANVEVNFSQNGVIPLFLAIEKGYAEIVLLLISHGAKLRVKNKDGKTPLEFALLRESGRIAEMIHYALQNDLCVQSIATAPIQQNGKAVVLFADICGSTALYEKCGNERALKIILSTLNILILEVAKHKGTLIKTIGDEIMCSFPNINLATQAACAMHFEIDAQRPGVDQSIQIKIGFHHGEVIYKASDLYGDTVNIAARVTAMTGAGQIMTTQAVVDSLPSGFANRVRPVMRAALRGKQDSFPLFEILWEPDHTFVGRIGLTSLRKPSYDFGDEIIKLGIVSA